MAPIPAIPVLSPPVAVLPVVVDEIVTSGGGGVDVDELCCRLAAVVTVVGLAADWVRFAMIMSLRRVRVPPSAAAGDSDGAAMATGPEVALAMSGSFLALNKRILER